ncbi:MAG: UDP-N-acetylmuramoyl-L-alanyl-D-glutamate--2,6-diaminopimelate ligase [Gammaproteobacteria bacterium]|jgi:UDP-N-acetylmuramoyl-L-alanyl-D-glutamate--2,6-diaminopimelate ligase
MMPALSYSRHRMLHRLLDGIVEQAPALPVDDMTLDSRRVTPGALFVALSGTRVHGLQYVDQALANGCCAVLAEPDENWSRERIEALGLAVPVMVIDDLRFRIGMIASRFCGEPSEKLKVIGYTGTNGKSSCVWLTAGVLENCVMIGTMGNGRPGRLQKATHTTPDAITLQKMLAAYRKDGMSAVAMEVSSHALDQGRIDGVNVDIAVFTNLTRDHLDYHATMEAYGAAKKRLFALPGISKFVINIDDPFGHDLAKELCGQDKCLTFGINNASAKLFATNIRLHNRGLSLDLVWRDQEARLDSRFIGRFNIENLLAVTGALLSAGLPLQQIVKRLAQVPPVPGRMEQFGFAREPQIVVDYAHTPDALKNALEAAREHCQGHLICVFGCGGDRDRGKRPLMGEIAENLADRVILTDDNPRSESGDAIIAEIRAGMQGDPVVERDREAAIRLAIGEAGESDLVLVAGKGHEDYQINGDEVRHFSDRETVEAILEEMRT